MSSKNTLYNRINFTKLNENTLIWLFLLVISVILITSLDPQKQIADELFHIEGIRKIQNNEPMSSALTVIPGYHFIIGHVISLFNSDTLFSSRIVNLILSSFSILFCLLILKHFKDPRVNEKSILVYLLPTIFPFFFLLYTDLTALSFVLGCFYFSLEKKYHIAGILGILSFLIRQTNIVWITFIYLYLLMEHLDGDFSWKKISSFFKPSISYILCATVFISFVLWNGGISMGDKSMHPDLTLSLTNPIFFLFNFGVIFFPYCLANSKILFQKLETSPTLWLIGALVFIIVFFNCKFDHYYNTIPVFLRNMILIDVQKSLTSKVLFSLIATFGFLNIAITKLRKPNMYLMYPLFLLLISSSTLVEQRYYIVGLVFFILFISNFKGLKTQLLYSAILTTVVWSIVSNGIIFL